MFALGRIWILLISIYSLQCQDIRWRWIKGSSHGNQIMTESSPGSRSGSASWQESYQNLWVFGGQVFDPKTKKRQLRNDLWKFDTYNRKWTRIHPGSEITDISIENSHRAPLPRHLSSICGIPDKVIVLFGGSGKDQFSYGDTWVFYIPESTWLPLSEMIKRFKNETIGVFPSPRGSPVFWCLRDEMYIFGGADNKDHMLRDMWKFDMVNLMWEETHVSQQKNKNPLSASLVTMPQGRTGAASWVGLDSTLYMFSGNQKNGNFRSKHLNSGFGTDLWRYDITKGEWRLIMGKEGECKSGVYGKIGHPNEKNIPGCRRGAATWTDTNGNIWLFGGDGASSDPQSVSDIIPSKILADLWFYDIDRRVWYWMGGSDKGDSAGEYTDIDLSYATGIYPSSRTEAIHWTLYNEFYISGGIGHDSTEAFGLLSDIWSIDAHTKVVYNYTVYLGTIFMIIFGSFSLILLVVVAYMYSRKHFQGLDRYDSSTMNNVQYSMLSTDGD